jgi:hypothetical protein
MENKKRITFLMSAANDRISYKKNDSYDLDESEALSLIAAKIAVAADAEKPEEIKAEVKKVKVKGK